jgi:hypothetical protein
MAEDSIVISDRYRSPIVAQNRNDSGGGIVLRPSRGWPIIMPDAELDRLFAFAPDKAHIQRFQVGPKGAPAATYSDE